jgi:hypothetical protein
MQQCVCKSHFTLLILSSRSFLSRTRKLSLVKFHNGCAYFIHSVLTPSYGKWGEQFYHTLHSVIHGFPFFFKYTPSSSDFLHFRHRHGKSEMYIRALYCIVQHSNRLEGLQITQRRYHIPLEPNCCVVKFSISLLTGRCEDG